MCKYCEALEKNSNGEHEVVPIWDVSTKDGTMIEMACIIKPTPISIRKTPETPGKLQVVLFSDSLEIPISYCPMCGKKL